MAGPAWEEEDARGEDRSMAYGLFPIMTKDSCTRSSSRKIERNQELPYHARMVDADD